MSKMPAIKALPLCAFLLLSTQCHRDSSPLQGLQAIIPENERTQVMVLGTFHFSEAGNEFNPSFVNAIETSL